MRVTIIGAGYVGLTTAAGLTAFGTEVCCVDRDPERIALLQQGKIPFFEPGLTEEVDRHRKSGRITFQTNLKAGIEWADVVILAVGTPQMAEGEADISAVLEVADQIGACLSSYKLIVIKSTVPCGTSERVYERMAAAVKPDVPFDVVCNPEFLREGQALADFFEPARIVIGRRPGGEAAVEKLCELYRPFKDKSVPFVITDYQTAELIKYGANSFLAMKVAFSNEMARLCGGLGACVDELLEGIGLDARIGRTYLNPGPGFGGSCLPKDTAALLHTARSAGQDIPLIEATRTSNRVHQDYLAQMIRDRLPLKTGGRIAWLGIAFKAGTDDVRNSPAIAIANDLLLYGVQLIVYDPQALANARRLWAGQVSYAMDVHEAVTGADAVIIGTEWPEFAQIDWKQVGQMMVGNHVIDLRNCIDQEEVKRVGLIYQGVGY